MEIATCSGFKNVAQTPQEPVVATPVGRIHNHEISGARPNIINAK
jgi:hypothetical protein